MTSRQLNTVFMLFKWVLCAIAVYVLSCLPCLAQINVQQPMFQMTSVQTVFDPYNVQGIAYWWVSEDITNGWTVTNWYDRIQGALLTQSTHSLRPTNATDGVYFDGTTRLKNSPTITWGTNYSVWFVLKPDNVAAGYQHLFGTDTFDRSVAFNTDYAGQIKAFWNGQMEGKITPAVFGDAIFMHTNEFTGVCLTNGSYASAGSGFDTWTQANVGAGDAGVGYKGFLTEIIIITNDKPNTFYATPLSCLQLSTNLHQYRTNKYGGSP